MRYGFTAQFRLTDGNDDQIQAECDQVMDELVRLEAIDPAIGATPWAPGTQEVEISYVVEAPSCQAAESEGMLLLATALQPVREAAGGWPFLDHRELHQVMLDVPEEDTSLEPPEDLADLDI